MLRPVYCLVDPGTVQAAERSAEAGRDQLMSGISQTPRFSIIDLAWRTAYRTAFPVARVWWRLRRKQHQGALVAVYVGQALLLVRSSYRSAWNFPGGGVRSGETPDAAARRELIEEIGLSAPSLIPAGIACGLWEGLRDQVHFFELRLDRQPALLLDNREIVAARLVAPEKLQDFALTGPVAVYVERMSAAVRNRP